MTGIVSMNNIKIRKKTTAVIYTYITLRVPCTPQVGFLSPWSVCFGSSEFANSLIDIVSWCVDDGQ